MLHYLDTIFGHHRGDQTLLAGHLAVALGAKALEPRVPLGAAVAAAFGLDLLWPILLLLGVESVRIHAGDTAFTNLAFDSYPWSHSLLAVMGWSGLFLVFGRRIYHSWRIGALLGGLVLSHWFLDLITHRPDLPLWPDGPLSGFGLWNSIPGTLLVEGSLFAVGIWLYIGSSSARDGVGRWGLAALLVLVGLIWVTQPWSPPPPSETAVAWGALILWLLPPWAHWIDVHRTSRGGVTVRAGSGSAPAVR